MSILDYFKTQSTLPNPSGTLSTSMPSRAIAAANRMVSAVVSSQSWNAKQKRQRKAVHNNSYSPQLRAEMGKATLQFGATAVARKYSVKLGTVNESTMRGLKQAYVLEGQRKRRREDLMTVMSLPHKKRGRPLLLGKTLDAVQSYILKLRERGCPVNTEIVRAAARGIVQTMGTTRLAEYGGPSTLSVAWAKSLLQRMNFTKRRGSTKSGMAPDNFEKVKETFLSEIIETVEMNDIPGDLIFNWDQTGINGPWSSLDHGQEGEKTDFNNWTAGQKTDNGCYLWKHDG